MAKKLDRNLIRLLGERIAKDVIRERAGKIGNVPFTKLEADIYAAALRVAAKDIYLAVTPEQPIVNQID